MSTTHSDYIAHLRTLDAAWLDGLRAIGFTKQASRMIHKQTGIVASRLGYDNGYMHRFNGQSVYADTVADVDAVVRQVAAATRG